MKYSIFLVFFAPFLTGIAFAEPLSAVVTFASTAVTAEGVTKQTQYQDLLVRDNTTVWSQRIVPEAEPLEAAHHHQEGNQHHHNLNFSLAGRWIELDSNSQPRFRLVRAQDRTIIEPRVNEYGTLGFDGVWETAFYQVNRTALQAMTVLKKPAAKNTRWYETQDERVFTRILWDEKNAIPLTIEMGSRDGKVFNKTTFKLVPTSAILPWDKLSDYQTMAYEDLLD